MARDAKGLSRRARAKILARVLAGASTLGLFALCGCSLLLNVDGLDVADSAADVEGGPLDGANDGAHDAGDGATRADSSDGSASDGQSDGQSDGAGSAEAGKDSATDGADGADGAGDGSRGDADASAPDAAAADAAEGGANDGAAVDGSDAGAPDASDGGPAVGPDGCALVTHSNGVGQTWQDCAALGTRNRTEAQSACEALTTTASCVAGTGCNLSYAGVSIAGSGGAMTTYLWIYGASNMSNYNPGDVLTYASGAVQCNNLPRASATWR